MEKKKRIRKTIRMVLKDAGREPLQKREQNVAKSTVKQKDLKV
ncbi:hypothetical protein RJD24_06895 [Bacillaceae bacterium IKA-2]|jgi:uncharacterized protein YneF (UPF0154 family)|nr:hypothetical protein RJD24_06895 [Bacillaceae bacterium IKA-2]